MPTPYTWSSVSNSDLPGADLVTRSLLWGTQWTSSTISFSFPALGSSWSEDPTTGYGPTDGSGEPWSGGFDTLSAEERAATRAILKSWSDVAALDFVEVEDSAATVGDIRLAYAAGSDTGFTDAVAWVKNAPAPSAGAGDVWLNSEESIYTTAWTKGSFEYAVVLHEIGHALGLKHPFGATVYNATLLDPSLDSKSFTVMSYGAEPGDSSSYFSYFPTTPMILDVLAIQHLYGANTSFKSTNTTYTFSGTGDYHQTIWDTGGVDTLVYNSTKDGWIDLREGYGFGSKIGNDVYVHDYDGAWDPYVVNNVWIAFGAVIENARGGSGNDSIFGNAAANLLAGGAGNDILDGLAGADTMQGGPGDDDYYVDSTTDVVTESPDPLNGGVDYVYSTVNRALGPYQESLFLLGPDAIIGTGNVLDNYLAGNDANNVLNGGTGNDTLDGQAGADTMKGGTGNDGYYVGETTDVVTESSDALNGGVDTVYATVSRTLGAYQEYLYLQGPDAINGTGNALANYLAGNDAINVLSGGTGNDTLEGMAGADTMRGGAGDDDYYVSDTTDVITESSDPLNGGDDTVYTTVSRALGPYQESLVLQGSNAINGTGNVLANYLVGNDANNVLSGGAGNDTLNGLAGADTMQGGTGDDDYYVDSTTDVITESSDALNGGDDYVYTTVSRALGPYQESLVLQGPNAINGTGNVLANYLVGNDANNVLSGGAGNDTLMGAAGNDVYGFNTALSGIGNVDRLLDFASGSDSLRLDDDIFTAFAGGTTVLPGEFRSGANATTAADGDDYLIYDTTTGALYYDADGTGAGATAIWFAVLGNATHPALSATDFLVVA